MSGRPCRSRPRTVSPSGILGRMSVSGVRMRRLPKDTVIPLSIFAAIGAVTAAFLSIGASRQEYVWLRGPYQQVQEPLTASPRYFGVLANWDGQWFQSIAENGYPVPLPMVDGHVAQNEWAFYPLYPALVRGVMTVTTLDYPVSAWLVSLVCAFAAMVLLYRLTLPRMGRFGAGALIACVAAYAASPLLQAGYAESLTLLLVVGSLLALERRRYVLVLLCALLLALTRPLLLPLAAVIAIHWLQRYRAARNGVEDFPTPARVSVAAVAVGTAALFGLWPAIAALVTGTPNAYLVTLAAWPVNMAAGGVLGGWTDEVWQMTALGWVAIVVALAVIYLGARRGSAVWGLELRSWAVLYPLYLLAATRPSPSILRYFLLAIAPLWPLPDPPGEETSTTRRSAWAFLVLLVVVGLVGQFLWTTRVFTIDVSPSLQTFP